MPYEGDPRVLDNLILKKRLLDAGDVSHYRYRTLIVVSSGVMRGVCGGAHAIALDKFGLTNAFDVAVGVSTGAPMLGFFLAGQIQQCLSIYWDEAAGDKFINPRRIYRRGRPIADTDYLCGVFRQKMDQEAVLRSRTRFYAGATCVHTGQAHLLNVKQATPDPVEAMHASCAMPRLCGRTVTVGGVECVDGAVSSNMPIRESVDAFEPTDILVLANCPRDEKERLSIKLLSRVLVRGFSGEFRAAFHSRNSRTEAELHYLRTQKRRRFGIKWIRDGLRSFERNPAKLYAAAVREEADMYALLVQAKERVDQKTATNAAE